VPCPLSCHRSQGGNVLIANKPAPSADKALVELVLDSLSEDKAQQVVSIDLAGKASFADLMVIATGRSHRHVSAISDHLLRRLKEAGYGQARVEGLPHCHWVLIDAGDVVVHVFRSEVREFYNLEKIWSSPFAAMPAEQMAI